MAKKRGKKTNNFAKNLTVISLLLISILLFILIYGEAGVVGGILSPILGGILGGVKYVIPIGCIGIAIALAKEDKNYVLAKLIEFIIILICISAIISILEISKGTIVQIEDGKIKTEFKTVLEASYTIGKTNIGGGTIGMIVSYPLINLLGMSGASVSIIGVAVILIVFMFGIEPSEILANLMDSIEERRLEREEERQLRKEERHSRREEKAIPKRGRKSKEEVEEDEDDEEAPQVDEEQIKINLNNINKKEKVKLFGKKEENEKAKTEDELFVQEEKTKENETKERLQLEHSTIIVEEDDYETPPIDLMTEGRSSNINKNDEKAFEDVAKKLKKTLTSFGVSAKVESVSVGPAITRYELKPAEGVRVSQIAKLADDIALNLAAESIRIEAPIPGKQAVGIEIPNKEKELVNLRDIIESVEFNENNSNLAFALGKDVAGVKVVTDIAKMPHVLIAGSTGSGKSVCINTLITSIIYKSKPSDVKLIMVDPKVVELSVYNGIPHLLIPVVTDPKKAAGALAWAVQEMVNRYSLFAEKGVRDIKGYNTALQQEDLGGKLPQIVIVIDELADLMMVAKKEVEDAICRLAQMARAAGMHLVIATQRPSVDVITGIIKANIPSRISFAVSSQIDSRTILDMAGAEDLLGKGDMLFYPMGASKPVRIQGAFISDKEVEKIVGFIKSNGEATYNEDIIEKIENSNKSDKELEDMNDEDDDTDPLLMDAIETIIGLGQASTSFIQRRFKVGYARAGRIIDQMEERGIISGYEGSKPRQVLITKERWEELKMTKPPDEEEEE